MRDQGEKFLGCKKRYKALYDTSESALNVRQGWAWELADITGAREYQGYAP
jgi:hypothetical protein